MHPSVRLLSLERCSLHPSRVLHASTTCRHQVAPRSFPVRQIRYNSSDDPTLTERIRRKIWGTDSPPGLKDPYGGRGVFEQRWSGERQPSQEQEAEPIEQEGEIAPPDAYTEATNWEGLEHIGHLGKWTDLNKKNPADQYIPWTRSRKIQVRQLQEAAHQAAVELCMLHKIKKPLTSITESVGGQYPEQISKMIMDCKVKSDTDWENAIVFPNMRVQHALLHAFKHHVPGSRYRSLSTDKILQKAGVNLDDPQTKSQDKQMELEHKMASSAGDYTTLEFRDPEVKFAFLKRFTQLTRFYLPDSFINEMKKVSDLLTYVTMESTRASPKIAAQLDARGSLKELPNVKIYDRRQTRGDVDVSVGRQKIIKAELERRGLIENTL